MIDALRTDLKFGLRQLTRAPVFSLVSAVSIAVGIAVAVGAFSVLNGTLFKPLPVPDANEIYHVFTSGSAYGSDDDRFEESSYRDFEDYAATGAFTGLAASMRPRHLAVAAGSDAPADQWLGFVSPNFFDVLRLPMHHGRAFSAADNDAAIVITYPYWERQFGSDPSAVGRVIRANGVALTIVGVAPAGFRGVTFAAPAIGWANATYAPLITGELDVLTSRSDRKFEVVGRLASGESRDVAVAKLNALVPGLVADNPRAWRDMKEQPRSISVLSHRESLAPPGQAGELIFVTTVCSVLIVLLLLLVCTNVAGLLLARAVARRRETAVRLSLGASRARLLRQLLTESVLLAFLGGFFGLVAVVWTGQLLRRVALVDSFNLQPDWRVLLAAFGISLLCAIFFGLAPALQSLRVDLRSALSNSASAPQGNRMRGVLIALQVAVSCLLILFAVSATRGVKTFQNADTGVPDEGLLIANLSLTSFARDSVRTAGYIRDVEEMLDATPWILGSARTWMVPFSELRINRSVTLPGAVSYSPSYNVVGNDYFDVMQAKVIAGRAFDGRDRAGSPRVVVVNQAFNRMFPDVRPGATIDIDEDKGVQVIGIVEDIRYDGLEAPRPMYFASIVQDSDYAGYVSNLMIRVAPGTEREAIANLQQLIRNRFPDVSTPDIRTQRDYMAFRALPQRITARAALVTGSIELILATVGLYGLLLVAMLSRTREIGVRLALGAAPRSATWAVLKSGLRYALAGGGIGLLLGVPAMIITARIMKGARADDPLPFVAAFVAVITAAALAAVVPALRAARIQPAAALRSDE